MTLNIRMQFALAAVIASGIPIFAQAQDVSARDAAPIDLTGTWVSIVNEDWRWRMVTPPKGDFASLPLSPRGIETGNAWDASMDGSCKAYGAAGLLRMPTRLRIRWDGDDVLEIETDAGQQTRRLVFDAALSVSEAAPPTLQGRSRAEWQRPSGAPESEVTNIGTLKVVTANLAPAWLRRNGAPYSDQTRMTEYFSRFSSPDEAEWFVVTTIVEDPVYLNGPYITSSHFRRERNNSGWNPVPCRDDGRAEAQ